MGLFNIASWFSTSEAEKTDYDPVSSKAKLSLSYEQSVKDCEKQIEKLSKRGQDASWFENHKHMCERKAQEAMHDAHVELARETYESSYSDTINAAIGSIDWTIEGDEKYD
jgi:hypothetical protein